MAVGGGPLQFLNPKLRRESEGEEGKKTSVQYVLYSG